MHEGFVHDLKELGDRVVPGVVFVVLNHPVRRSVDVEVVADDVSGVFSRNIVFTDWTNAASTLHIARILTNHTGALERIREWTPETTAANDIVVVVELNEFCVRRVGGVQREIFGAVEIRNATDVALNRGSSLTVWASKVEEQSKGTYKQVLR